MHVSQYKEDLREAAQREMSRIRRNIKNGHGSKGYIALRKEKLKNAENAMDSGDLMQISVTYCDLMSL